MNTRRLKKGVTLGFRALTLSSVATSALLFSASAHATTLDDIVRDALLSDDKTLALSQQEQALVELSKSVDTLPDPILSFSLANLPTDGFDLNQEPMTQAIIGVSQILPKGNSTQIKALIKQSQSKLKPYERAVRAAQLKMLITQEWANLTGVYERELLLLDAISWLNQLSDATEAKYARAKQGIRQRDILLAQIQQAEFEQAATELKATQAQIIARFSKWCTLPIDVRDVSTQSLTQLGHNLQASSDLIDAKSTSDRVDILSRHPELRKYDQHINVARHKTDLAEQGYLPEWRFNASYGLRRDDDNGNSRADFLSVGVAVSVPLFSNRKQDHAVSASQLETESFKTEKRLALKERLAYWQSLDANIAGLKEREKQYTAYIIPQYQILLESLMASYASDGLAITEVLQTKVDLLAAQRDLVNIKVETLHALTQRNYLLVADTQQQGEQ